MLKKIAVRNLPPIVIIDGQELQSIDFLAVARHRIPITLGDNAIVRIRAARALIEKLAAQGDKVYGVTTGFGHLSSVHIPQEQLVELQHNLIRSHSAGVGEFLSEEVSRGMMLLLAASLARGHSGMRVEVVRLLVEMLNASLYPLIPSHGSVGASGDLAPLAHLALVLIGEGEAEYQGQHLSGSAALQKAGLFPLQLQAKEDLALINGTHLMESIVVLALADACTLLLSAEVAYAMSLEGLLGSHVPLDPRIHKRRGQHGQEQSASRLRSLVQESEINRSHDTCPRVQDPYTLRCAPQVFGAIRDALDYCEQVFDRELGAVTDNPLLFPDDDAVLSGGNFHGQPLALALDMLGIALAQLASFSERRIYMLLGPRDWDSTAPLFLTPQPGLNSGLMITQYIAASLVNEIKILAHPASIDSIPTSAGMEGFVSMGVTSAHKVQKIIEQSRQIIAIEFLCAAQLLEFRLPLCPGRGAEEGYKQVRNLVLKLERDRVLSPDIQILTQAIQDELFSHIGS